MPDISQLACSQLTQSQLAVKTDRQEATMCHSWLLSQTYNLTKIHCRYVFQGRKELLTRSRFLVATCTFVRTTSRPSLLTRTPPSASIQPQMRPGDSFGRQLVGLDVV